MFAASPQDAGEGGYRTEGQESIGLKENQLVVAGVPEHFNLPWHLADEGGDFKEAGIDLRFREYPGGTGAMTAALARRQVDLAIVLTEGALADVARRRESVLIKTYVESPLIWGIHVSADSPLQSIEQVQGKRYAISRYGSGSHMIAIVDAAQRNWNTDGIDFVVVDSLEGGRQALLDGEADVFFWELYTTQPFVDAGEFRRVGERRTLWPAFVVEVDNQAWEERRDLIVKALSIVNLRCQQLMDDPLAAEAISQRYKLELGQSQRWLQETRWSTNFEPPLDGLDTALAFLQRLELVGDQPLQIDDVWCQIEIPQ